MFGRGGKLLIDFNTINLYDPNQKLKNFSTSNHIVCAIINLLYLQAGEGDIDTDETKRRDIELTVLRQKEYYD